MCDKFIVVDIDIDISCAQKQTCKLRDYEFIASAAFNTLTEEIKKNGPPKFSLEFLVTSLIFAAVPT